MSLPTASTTGATTATAATTPTNNQQPQNCYLYENQNCDDKDLDETNSKPHLSFPFLLHTPFLAINQCKYK